MNPETIIMAKVQLAVTPLGARLFRNQVGSYQLKDGRWLSSGIGGPGGADLVGWTPLTIGPQHLGQRLAVFTALEVKTAKGTPTDQQRDFLQGVRDQGGLAHLVRSPDEAYAFLKAQLP